MTGDPQTLDPNNNEQKEVHVSCLGPSNNEPNAEAQQLEAKGDGRVRGERALRISEDWLRLAIENVIHFAIITMDATGTIVAWNAGAESMFGYHPNEAIGKSLDMIFTPEDQVRDVHAQEMAKARTSGRAADNRWHLRKDGSRFYVNGVLTSLWENHLIGYAKIVLDLTERKQAEDALQELNETLESRVEERTEQIRKLATQLTMSEQVERRRISQILHDDLQQRLYSLNFQLTAARIAIDVGEPENARQLLIEIEEALNSTVEITRNLSVDLSPPILHQEGLYEAIWWLALQMQQQQGLTITVQAAEPIKLPDEDLRVMLFQTVRELLFNVVKHAGVTEATVVLAYVDEQIRIRISDGGVGFEIGAEREQNSQGLTRIQQRLQLVGGSLVIDTAPGQGTRITIYSPLRRANQP